MGSLVADSSFLIALLSRRDKDHAWAVATTRELSYPWLTCEAALSEAFYVLGPPGLEALGPLLERRVLQSTFELQAELAEVLALLRKYKDVPMSLADACLVRMTETLPDPVVVTTDSDFRIYRRHGRRMVPTRMP